jgi:TonB family protein
MTNDARHTWLQLLLSWLTGDTTRREEEALDTLSKSDEFLAEAMEGYRAFPEENHVAAVTRLKADIRSRHSKKQRGLLFYPLRVAAAVTAVAVVWLIIRQLSNDRQEMAVASAPLSTHSQSTTDSLAPMASTYAAPLETPGDKSVTLDEAPLPAQRDRKAPAPKNLPPAPPAKEEEGAVVAFEAETPLESKIEEAPASGAVAPAEKMDADDAVPEALAPVSAASPPAAQPEIGWDAFKLFVEKNLHYPQAAAQNGIEGNVVVRFTIEADGSLSGFQIQQSTGYGCDEEAVRLLKESGKWKPAGPATYSFTFPAKKRK